MNSKAQFEAILNATAEQFGLTKREILDQNKKRTPSIARQVAMYAAHTSTIATFEEIGQFFGGRHHTTVTHAIRRIEDQIETSSIINNAVERISEAVKP